MRQTERPDAGEAPLTVGVVTSSISERAGGMFDAVRLACKSIRSSGVEIAVHGVDDGSEREQPSWHPVRARAHRRAGPAAFGYSPSLLRTVLSADYDALHQHGLWQYPSVAALQWRLRTGKPLVVSPHGMLDPWAMRLSPNKKRLAALLFERRNLRGASCLHALHEAEAETLRGLGLHAPIAVIPNGVALPEEKPGAAFPAASPAAAGGDTRAILLFLGRLHEKKGVANVLRAWARLRQSDPSIARRWRIVVAGWDDGGHLSTLAEIAREAGITEDVEFAGPVFGAKKEALLRASSAFILASYSEGLPIAVLEAWAHRLPVFMTRACNLPEGYGRGAAVEIASDPEAMAATLATHLGREDLPGMGDAGHELVVQKFSWERIGMQFCQLYAWLRCPQAVQRPEFVRGTAA